MLETTLATQFVAGSNLKSTPLGAGWRFALPRLRYDRIRVLGHPSPATLAGLTDACDHLEVTTGDGGVQPPLGASDLIVVATGRVRGRGASLARDAANVWAEHPLPGNVYVYRLSPPFGEVATICPAGDRVMSSFLSRHARTDPAARRLTPRLVLDRTCSHRFVAAARRRRGYLLGSPAPPGQPPAYLQPLLRQSGLDPERLRWGITVPGAYASKKVLVFLLEPGSDAPCAIVKLTRTAAYNARLETEHRALSALSGLTVGPPGSVPRALGIEREGGLVLMAESAAEGVPFRLASTGRADCLFLAATLDLLLDLGAVTPARGRVPAAEAAAAFAEIVDRLVANRHVPTAHEAFLREQVKAVGRSPRAFPLAFQHGDPGVWNVLTRPPGDVTLLDWEAAEPEGVPLWDLFYLFRSFGSLMRTSGRTQIGVPDDPRLLARLIAAVGHQTRQLDLDPSLVEPLHYLCWTHRALKETTRRAPTDLAQGPFFRLLAASIDARHNPALASLFAAGGPGV